MDHIRTQRHPQAAVPAPLPSPPPPSAEELRQLRVARHQASQRAQQNAAWARELLAASAGPSAGPSAASAAVDGGRFAGLSAAELRTRLAESEDALVAARTAVDRAAGRSWEDEEIEAMRSAADAADASADGLADALAAARTRMEQRRAAGRRSEMVVRL